VTIVDNASSDDGLAVVADLDVVGVPLSTNGGFGHGCNEGWKRGVSPYVLFLNPDARIDPTSLERLVAVLEADSGVGLAAPKILDEDGHLDYSQRRFPRLRSTYAQAFFLHRVAPEASWADELIRDPAAYERARSADWVSGACMLLRRTELEALGGFDEGYFLYCEDIDLCKRVRDLGLEIRFEPSATVVHEGGASMPRAALYPVLAASRLRYARRHRGRVGALLERIGIGIGSLTHLAVGKGGVQARKGHARSLRVVLSRAGRIP
jgi:GT2 family glycosyltransferase